MTAFLIAAVLLILLPLGFLFPVFLKRRHAPVQTPATIHNLAILREQLADLERERAAGALSEEDFREAREDLERRLVEENAAGEGAESPPAAVGQGSQNAPLAAALLALLLVAGGFSGYLLLGTPAALEAANLPAHHAAGNGMPTPEQVSAMVAELEEHTRKNPDDAEAWLNLARIYQALGRSAEAVGTYEKVEGKISADPELLTDYAEALVLAAMPQTPDDKQVAFAGKPRRLLKEALKLDPDFAKALFLAGAAAFEAGDKEEAAEYWERLLPRVEPGSELHALLTNNIERIRSEMSAKPKTRR